MVIDQSGIRHHIWLWLIEGIEGVVVMATHQKEMSLRAALALLCKKYYIVLALDK